MAFQLSPFYHNNWLRPLQQDLRPFRNFMDMTSPTHSHTLEPSYSYEASGSGAHFEIELPGVAKDDVYVEVEGHKLIVKGKRFKKRGEENIGEERKPSLTYLLEARLAQGVDLENITAESVGDGILVIDIPFKVEREAKRIEVGVRGTE